MILAAQPHSLFRLVPFGFDETRIRLRSALLKEKLDIICEVPFHREFQKSMGVTCRRYTVLVVWSQFETWRAVLTENDAGLLMPFNVAVMEERDSTLIVVNNWSGRRPTHASVGVSLMLHDVEAKLRRAFAKCNPDSISARIKV
jgi:uncharacterized protein (DUF302 family)